MRVAAWAVMLEREVVGGSWMRRSGIGVVLGAAVIAAATAGWMRSDEPVRTTIVVPAPPVVIERVAPATPPPPELPPPVPPPAPVIRARCAANVETIGVPLTDEVLGATQRDAFDAAQTFTMDDAGCAIAIAMADALVVTWDGGERFVRYAIDGRLESVVLAGDRAVMLRENRLGVVHAGDTAITWRGLDALAIPGDDAKLEGHARSWLWIAAAGPWTVVMRSHGAPAADKPAPTDPLPAARLLGISDDDGATWRFTTPPESETLAVTDDGRLWLTHDEWVGDDGGPGSRVVHTFASDLAYTRWLTDGKLPARRGAAAYQYRFETDRFWGCGGTQKLVAYHGRRAVTLESDLNPMNDPINLVQNGVAAYAIYREKLYRLRDMHSTPVASTYIQDLLGVDRAGTLIAHHGDLLLRWSPNGGWHVLWSAAMRP